MGYTIDSVKNAATAEEKEIIEGNMQRYDALLKSVKRDGIENLLAFLHQSTFYWDPAAVSHHSDYIGGLCQHSLNVYDRLSSKFHASLTPSMDCAAAGSPVTDENLIVAALLHDLCKIGTYDLAIKNVKSYDPEVVERERRTGARVQKDLGGQYVWTVKKGFVSADEQPLGHGEKSLDIVRDFIKVTDAEKYAIRWHMGFTEPKENWKYLGTTYKKYPLALYLSQADLEATYFMEEE